MKNWQSVYLTSTLMWVSACPGEQTSWHCCHISAYLQDQMRSQKIIFEDISTVFSNFIVSAISDLTEKMLNASYFLVMHWVSCQGLILFYFSQAVSGISSSKPSCPTIYSYGGRSFHSGAQLQMDAIEKLLNFAAVQLRHQTPHAAQLFSLATASFKNLFFPDYASVGCL